MRVSESGNIEFRDNYINGKLEGLSELWSDDGDIQDRSYYVNGKLEGLSEAWFDDGQKLEAFYKGGKQNVIST